MERPSLLAGLYRASVAMGSPSSGYGGVEEASASKKVRRSSAAGTAAVLSVSTAVIKAELANGYAVCAVCMSRLCRVPARRLHREPVESCLKSPL